MHAPFSNIETVARAICARQYAQHWPTGPANDAAIERHGHVVAALLDAGPIDETGAATGLSDADREGAACHVWRARHPEHAVPAAVPGVQISVLGSERSPPTKRCIRTHERPRRRVPGDSRRGRSGDGVVAGRYVFSTFTQSVPMPSSTGAPVPLWNCTLTSLAALTQARSTTPRRSSENAVRARSTPAPVGTPSAPSHLHSCCLARSPDALTDRSGASTQRRPSARATCSRACWAWTHPSGDSRQGWRCRRSWPAIMCLDHPPASPTDTPTSIDRRGIAAAHAVCYDAADSHHQGRHRNVARDRLRGSLECSAG